MMFMFSGSNRHLLYQVFDDRRRPLYKMCDRIALEKISNEEYTKHIQYAAMQTWKKSLNAEVIDEIIFNKNGIFITLFCFAQSYGKKTSYETIC